MLSCRALSWEHAENMLSIVAPYLLDSLVRAWQTWCLNHFGIADCITQFRVVSCEWFLNLHYQN